MHDDANNSEFGCDDHVAREIARTITNCNGNHRYRGKERTITLTRFRQQYEVNEFSNSGGQTLASSPFPKDALCALAARLIEWAADGDHVEIKINGGAQ